MNDYEVVIGLEIHAELKTKSKMFCSCRVVDSVTAEPNSAVCPVCLGMPGMLPVINKKAIELAMLVGLALNCTIQPLNLFARKNYFYPDLPKAYQISQYELPLATDGWVDIWVDGPNGTPERKRITIRRVHLEEDTGKLTHLVEGNKTLVDFNRSGVPLLEIVSEPDLRSDVEARTYAMKIRQILRYLDVNSGDMEKGVIRFEANVSIREKGNEELGTRTEVKNLNSFRSLTDAINFEQQRQQQLVRLGKTVVQDTMGWSERKKKTFSQRGKEEAHDYRYFPEPDLPPLQLQQQWIQKVQSRLVELPDARFDRYINNYGLSAYEADVLVEDKSVSDWFDAAVIGGGQPASVANWMINTLFSLMNDSKTPIEDVKVKPVALVSLIDLVEDGVVNTNTAKNVLSEMFVSGQGAAEIIEVKGLAQISDEASIDELIARILQEHPDQVEAYIGGKEQLRGWFFGQVMRATHGKANPKLVNNSLSRQLNHLSGK